MEHPLGSSRKLPLEWLQVLLVHLLVLQLKYVIIILI